MFQIKAFYATLCVDVLVRLPSLPVDPCDVIYVNNETLELNGSKMDTLFSMLF